MLQNAITVDQFENLLNYIIIIFNSKYVHDMYFEAFERLSKEIAERDIVIKIINENNFNFEKIEVQKEIKHVFPVGESIYKNLKNESPFKNHFNSKIEKINKNINNSISNKENNKNIHYAPNLLDIIYDLIHILPLWTGIMINEWNKRFSKYKFPSRFTNNPVESHFKIVKHSILNKMKKLMPSVIASQFYNRLQSKYLQYYSIKDESKSILSNDKPNMFYENWKDKKSNRKKKSGSYYSNQLDFSAKQIINDKYTSELNLDYLFGM